ncbi:TFIID-31kDa-domain-containing protein [Aureobasidium pullulans]|uniref:TFIID-31kDa-domain-containing protein n=1 Tax=Aureobasidium pullulans TaxID=5580 RepID=A0A4S8VA37_AURPU|nr:TFIID-31kDa-domain-containing protein [Aureobasidium pullulans]THW50988.1 TFIID-31kDa-domain-containing protein [Aureobasidium pullulans]THW94090.1 TFIID-31kDa-domain-containing protein [Aureobasidium pullulans]THW95236.1 TFIID-31kDa-domain-containing protein [Aureobasidium pullulans]THX25498.1 TFIID-31kDa-domain-containing protein [Aureobasidium pullulans]
MASPATESAQKSASNPPQAAQSSTPAPATTTSTAQPSDPQPTSTTDDGLSRRPRDARLIHLILSAQGVHSYQERVPLQLLDFAYRYTSSVLADAFRLSSEGYASAPGAPTTSKRSEATDGSNITVNALRQAIASRQDYQFQGALPKEFMMEQAVERNRVQLPKVQKSWGVQLPPEKYCLTGTGWSLRDLWEEDEVAEGAEGERREANGDVRMEGGVDVKADGAEEKDAMDSFEDVFGSGAQGDGDGDQEMAEA